MTCHPLTSHGPRTAGHNAAVQALLDAGGSATEVGDGPTPLEEARTHCHTDVVLTLLQHAAKGQGGGGVVPADLRKEAEAQIRAQPNCAPPKAAARDEL